MDFGVAFPASPQAYRDVELAEKLGFTHAWLDDSQLLFSDPYVSLALCAVHTSKIALGVGVTNPSSRIAPVTANSIATVNQLAPGRTMLGIGTGNTARRTLGMPAARVADLREHVRVVRDLLAGKTTSYTEGGRHRQIRFLNPGTTWINTDTPVPVYVAGSGPRVLEVAGAVADGIILFGAVSPSLADFVMSRVRSGARAAGRDPATISVMCMTAFWLTEPGENLESDRVRAMIGPFVSSAANIFALSAPDPGMLPAELRDDIMAFRDIFVHPDGPEESRHLDMYSGYAVGLRPEVAPLITERIIRATTLTGTAAEIVSAVEGMRAAGIDKVAIRPVIDHSTTMETFAREVISRAG